jgi:hypothetical protein
MMKSFDEIQKLGRENFDTALSSFGEVNRGFQAIATEMTDYGKKAFEDGAKTFEQLVGCKSIEQAVDVQTAYAKKAYDDYIAQMTKLSEMYADLAKEAYKPVETAYQKAS